MSIIAVECPSCKRKILVEIRAGANFVECTDANRFDIEDQKIHSSPKGCGNRFLVNKRLVTTTEITTYSIKQEKKTDYAV